MSVVSYYQAALNILHWPLLVTRCQIFHKVGWHCFQRVVRRRFSYLYKSRLPQTDPRDAPIVLCTKVDAQYDKLVTDDCRLYTEREFGTKF